MKLFLLSIYSGILCSAAFSQTTYTWIGTDNAAWTTSTNWSPTRTTLATNDILVFNDNISKTIASVVLNSNKQKLFCYNNKKTLHTNQ